jgi:hypothetical protein
MTTCRTTDGRTATWRVWIWRTGIALAALPAFSAPAGAQWVNIPTAAVPAPPRGSDGRPDLDAPVPRTADGKPDLSGIWEPPAPPRYLRDLAADLKPGEVSMLPWAEAVYKERASGAWAREEPDANCLPQGVPKINAAPAPYRIIQMPGLVVIIYEAFTQWRQIFTDGRQLPRDPNPSWFGYSVGRWEGDTLVVDSTGFNGKVWLDQIGHPSTDALHVTERFRRVNFGQLEIQVTIDDAKAYARPWTATERVVLRPDTELIEFICNENSKDRDHLPAPPK